MFEYTIEEINETFLDKTYYFAVKEDGHIVDRFITREGAEEALVSYQQNSAIEETMAQELDTLEEILIERFKLEPKDARLRIREYTSFYM